MPEVEPLLLSLSQWRSLENVQFIETRAFTRRVVEAISDFEYRKIQEALLRRPAQGDVIRGSGGVRKLRVGYEGRGKRGAFRLIYYWHPIREIFLMLFLYAKNEQNDLSPEQVRALATAVRQEFK
ncbi:MAG TPA: type II toxin-antitoxin system RelE/ParE family toxin [Thermoanaerobaculia bacterium]|nr:type II toxin-antitoxin system RelE/ParE family toxin [Thermoanaerobaculia bacterium]